METGGHNRAISGTGDTIRGGTSRQRTGGTVINPVQTTRDLGWMATIKKLLGRQAIGTIEVGCDSNATLKGIQKWLNTILMTAC